MLVDVSPLSRPVHTLLLFLHEHDDWFSHDICARLLFRVRTRDKAHCSTSSVSSMECAGLRNTATDRAPLLSMSDQVQDMNEILSSIVAGPKSSLNIKYLLLAACIVVLSGNFAVATEEETTASFIAVHALTLPPVGVLALLVLENLSSLINEIFRTSFRCLCVRLCVSSSLPNVLARSQCACPHVQVGCSSSRVDSF